MIPKTIYQTWITKNVPQLLRDEITSRILARNPEYEYEFYDDSDIFYFIKENYDNDVLKAYQSLTVGAAKADFWRYLVLYKNGGVYLDLDSDIVVGLDTFIKDDDKAIISREHNADCGTFLQWCLIFEAGHPILEQTISDCLRNIKDPESAWKSFGARAMHWRSIFHITGPPVFSTAIKKTLADIDIGHSYDRKRVRRRGKPITRLRLRSPEHRAALLSRYLWNTRDDIINKELLRSKHKDIRCRFYGFDYKGKCQFRHKYHELLISEDHPHWTWTV